MPLAVESVDGIASFGQSNSEAIKYFVGFAIAMQQNERSSDARKFIIQINAINVDYHDYHPMKVIVLYAKACVCVVYFVKTARMQEKFALGGVNYDKN